MEAISYIVLILLSLLGYSAGAVGKAGKAVVLKPQIVDLVLVSVIWAGAIYCRVSLDFNKWLLILVWLVVGGLIGWLAVLPRELSEEKASAAKQPEETSTNPLKKLWQAWSRFSGRMGNFQNRVLLSFFFFIVVAPIALTMRALSDPLNLKYRGGDSLWLPRKDSDSPVSLEQFRRQF